MSRTQLVSTKNRLFADDALVTPQWFGSSPLGVHYTSTSNFSITSPRLAKGTSLRSISCLNPPATSLSGLQFPSIRDRSQVCYSWSLSLYNLTCMDTYTRSQQAVKTLDTRHARCWEAVRQLACLQRRHTTSWWRNSKTRTPDGLRCTGISCHMIWRLNDRSVELSFATK
ncbi:hypothetical protein BJX64DRAFT_27785 [Aspergillus heterothallicus]